MRDVRDRGRTAILIVDDHALFRESIARLLQREPDFEVVADVGSVEDALAVVEARSVDLVLLDFDLGQRNGFDFIRRAGAGDGTRRTLIVTAGIEPTVAAALIRGGVSGIFLKRDSADSLVQAIREAVNGKMSIDQDLFRAAMADEPDEAPRERLTERERQVLTGVFEGLANKEIAGQLGVSESSVKATLQQLFAKTGVRTRSQLVRIALERHKHDL